MGKQGTKSFARDFIFGWNRDHERCHYQPQVHAYFTFLRDSVPTLYLKTLISLSAPLRCSTVRGLKKIWSCLAGRGHVSWLRSQGSHNLLVLVVFRSHLLTGFPPPRIFVDGTSRKDVVQGILGDCWLLSTCAAVAKREDLIQKVVDPKQVSANLVTVRSRSYYGLM